jgi:sortase A
MTAVADEIVEPSLVESPDPKRKSRRGKVRGAVRRRLPTGPPKARSTRSLFVTWVLAGLSLVALWIMFYALVLSGLQTAHAQHNAYAKFREQLSQQVAPLGGVIPPGSPVALLSAPTMSVEDLVVVEGTAAGDLEKGPGHRRDTPLPGQPGISVVYGRATLFGGPFAAMTRAHAGDRIVATTGQGKFTYVVQDVRHVGEHYPPPLPAGAGGLTLVTSEGASVGDLWRPKRPVYVDARLQGAPQPSPGGGLSSVPAAEKAMSGDVGSLFTLVLWIPLLALAATMAVWAAVRWGRWQAWLAGAPIVAAALWGVSETALQLLPNLM